MSAILEVPEFHPVAEADVSPDVRVTISSIYGAPLDCYQIRAALADAIVLMALMPDGSGLAPRP